MRRPTNIQVIEQDGVPAFAVIPYADFLKLFPEDQDDTIPHEVVGIVAQEGCNLVRAWRLHLGLTQKEVAERAGMTQSALSQMEKADNEMRSNTLEKLAAAMGIAVEQLTD